jgi:hypothetical protein
MIGTIDVKVRLHLEMDVDEEDAREIVENMDYSMIHPLIQYSEVVEDDITERFDE